MTGKLSNTTADKLKLSKITIGSLQDMGYVVDYGAADDYTADDMDASCVCDGGGRRELQRDKTGRSNRRTLSEEGRQNAIAYGKSVLEGRKAKRHTYRLFKSQSRSGYVGDQSIRVFYLEDNEILSVEVFADDTGE
jgi:hypothetical protein